MLDLVEPGSLMADSTTVPARFVYGASGLGKSLDPGSASRNVEADAQVDAPLWLVKPLLERHMVAATPPVVYGERYQRKLNAGADCVSLRNLAPYFYEVGNKLNAAYLRDVGFSRFLVNTFHTRYYELISKGLSSMTGEEVLVLHSKLSVEEQQLFEGGRVSTTHFDSWLQNGKPAAGKRPSVQRLKKRPSEQAAAPPLAPALRQLRSH